MAAKKKRSGWTFRATLHNPAEGSGTWTSAELPSDSAERLGSKARVPVKGTVNGVAFSSSAMPTGRGNHYVVVNAELRKATGTKAGDEVELTVARDETPRVMEAPEDLAAALKKTGAKAAKTRWDALPYSHRKEYVDWISSAKKEETRAARVSKAVAMLTEGTKLK